MSLRFSANLGMLWTGLPLPEAIRAAARAGFDAVECHWPYDVPVSEVRAALNDTGLPLLSLNTRRGSGGAFGLSALPDRQDEARALIDEAIDYAADVGAYMVHVLAGKAEGGAAHACFRDALSYACGRAGPLGLTVLIEPLNRHDVPGYFLKTTDQARRLLREVNHPALKLMFDCYHVQRTEGDLGHRLRALAPVIGHVQVASAPDRGAPDHGELNYDAVWQVLSDMGWSAPIGAEYRPQGPTEDSLGWLKDLHQRNFSGSSASNR